MHFHGRWNLPRPYALCPSVKWLCQSKIYFQIEYKIWCNDNSLCLYSTFLCSFWTFSHFIFTKLWTGVFWRRKKDWAWFFICEMRWRHGSLQFHLLLTFSYLGLVCALKCQGPVGKIVASGSNSLGWALGRTFALSLNFSISKMGMIIVPAT